MFFQKRNLVDQVDVLQGRVNFFDTRLCAVEHNVKERKKDTDGLFISLIITLCMLCVLTIICAYSYNRIEKLEDRVSDLELVHCTDCEVHCGD